MPLTYQVTFTVWLAVMLKARVAPTISVKGVAGAKPVMIGATGEGAAVTVHIHVCIALPLELFAIALTFHVPSTALVLV